MRDTGGLRPVPKTAIFLAGMAGAIIIGLKPALLSSYVSHAGINEIVAGYLVSVEVVAALLGNLVIVARAHVWDRRRMLVVALIALLAGNLVSGIANGTVQLGCVRFVAGLGEGMTTGLFAATIAGDPRPDRQFGLFTVIVLLVAAGAYQLVPIVLAFGGLPGFFWMLSILAILALILSPAAPRRPLVEGEGAGKGTPTLLEKGMVEKGTPALLEKGTPTLTQGMTQGTPTRSSGRLNVAVLVAGTIAYYLSVGGVWPYMGQIGLAAGLTAAGVASVFAYSQIWGAIAAIVPMTIGNRFGRLWAIIVSVGIGIACLMLLIMNMDKPLAFNVAAQAFMFGWLMFFPYLMGLTSTMDPVGRLSSLVYTIQSIGFFLGPIICAQAIVFGGYVLLLWFGVICFAATLVGVAPLAARFDRLR